MKIFRKYCRQILLLLIATCAVSFLAQNLIIREVYKSNIKQGTFLDFFYGNNTVDENKLITSNAMPIKRMEFNFTNEVAFRTFQRAVNKSKSNRVTSVSKESTKAETSNTTSLSERLNKTKCFDVNKTSKEDISQTLKNDGRTESNNKVATSYMETDPNTVTGDTRNQWSERGGTALAIFILSAIGYNFTTMPNFNREIKLNGWQGAKHSRVLIKCCILWKNQVRTEYLSPNKTTRGKSLNLFATQLTCPIKGPFTDVFGITLEFAEQKCPIYQVDYITPFIPKLQKARQSFAVCLKILYGNVDNKLLIDWIEFYREIKVDKLFMFVYNITKDTKIIIRYYEDLGFLETRLFGFPWKNGRDLGMKKPVVWEDEQVVVYDCFYRLHGYTYIAIVDLDEFLLPRKHANVKDMMRYLMNTYPKAAGFAMKTFIFNKVWGVSGRSNGSDVVKYIQRTRALTGVKARPKNILIPSRVIADGLYTHEFNPKPGYESYIVNETIVIVNHYRNCYTNLAHACDKRKRITDTYIFKVVNRFQNRTKEWLCENLRETGTC